MCHKCAPGYYSKFEEFLMVISLFLFLAFVSGVVVYAIIMSVYHNFRPFIEWLGII